MSDPVSKLRKFDCIYCLHCKHEVSKSTWYSHHQQFFDKENGKLKEKTTCTQDSRPSFNFAEEESAIASSDDDGVSGYSCTIEDYEAPDDVSSTLILN